MQCTLRNRRIMHTLLALARICLSVRFFSLSKLFSSWRAVSRALMSSGRSFPPTEARKSLSRNGSEHQHKISHGEWIGDCVRECSLSLKHLLSLCHTVTLKVDFLHQESVDLLQVHLVPLFQVLNLSMELLHLGLQTEFIFIHGFSQSCQNIQLVFINEIHWENVNLNDGIKQRVSTYDPILLS